MTKSGKSTRKQFLLTDMFRKKEQISAICRKVNGYGPEKVARLDNLFVLNGYSDDSAVSVPRVAV